MAVEIEATQQCHQAKMKKTPLTFYTVLIVLFFVTTAIVEVVAINHN
jgi:ABC-type arginine transport system permease subunit